jgi:hypothetical protein
MFPHASENGCYLAKQFFHQCGVSRSGLKSDQADAWPNSKKKVKLALKPALRNNQDVAWFHFHIGTDIATFD